MFDGWEAQAPVVGRIAFAMLLGGAIGLEREMKDRPAGVRTHMLVAGAAAMLTGMGDMMLALAQHAYVLENGRITLKGTGRELLQNDQVRQAYVEARIRGDQEGQQELGARLQDPPVGQALVVICLAAREHFTLVGQEQRALEPNGAQHI